MKQETNKNKTGGNELNPLLATGWIPIEQGLPAIRKPVLILTDYGKCDVCYLRIEDGRHLVWVNDMRPQHTNGGVIAWMHLPACC